MSVKIFFCYAHKDRTLRNELEKHLSPLKRSEEHTTITWHDRKILPGMDWEHEIDIHLNSADIVLLLVSADFINSDYCYSGEMHQALDRHREGKAHVIPIILRPVDWQKTPIGDLQVLPEDGRPITKWRNRDEAFLNVARGVYEVIRSIPLSTTKQEFDSLLPENLQALQDILRERLYTLLETLNPKLRSDVQYVLEAKGKLLSQTQTDPDPQDSTLPAGTWQLLTLLVAQHISPNIDPVLASSAAVAIECFVCALELLDDIEDENQTPVVQVLGSARTLNVSATLLMLTQ